MIGDLLGIDSNTLEGLLAINYSDQVKLSHTLQSWLDNQPTPTTWRNIIKIIEGPLQDKTLATNIQQYFLQGGTVITHLILCRGFYVFA